MDGDKVTQLRQLLAEGYHLEAIESDERRVETVLRRGLLRVSLTFGAREAAGLLRLSTPSLAQKRRLRSWGP